MIIIKKHVPDVFLLIFLCYLDVSSIWLQLVGGDLPQDLLVNWEEHLQATLLDIIIPTGHTQSLSLLMCLQQLKKKMKRNI